MQSVGTASSLQSEHEKEKERENRRQTNQHCISTQFVDILSPRTKHFSTIIHIRDQLRATFLHFSSFS
jgi:hypothetical protein